MNLMRYLRNPALSGLFLFCLIKSNLVLAQMKMCPPPYETIKGSYANYLPGTFKTILFLALIAAISAAFNIFRIYKFKEEKWRGGKTHPYYVLIRRHARIAVGIFILFFGIVLFMFLKEVGTIRRY